MKSSLLQQGEIVALLLIQYVDSNQQTELVPPLFQTQWNGSSEKQRLKRRHDEVKRLNTLLMKVTTLEIGKPPPPQVSTQNSHF